MREGYRDASHLKIKIYVARKIREKRLDYPDFPLVGACYRVFIKYCVFSKVLKYIPDSGLSRFPLVVSTMAGQTPALQQNLQSSEKSQHLKEKNNI